MIVTQTRAQGLFYAFLMSQLLLIKLIKPSPYWLVVFTLWGLVLGLAASALYFMNRKRKVEANEVVSGACACVFRGLGAAKACARSRSCVPWG